MDYGLKKFTLSPVVKGSPYVGFGPSVDRAWDLIANDGLSVLTTQLLASRIADMAMILSG